MLNISRLIIAKSRRKKKKLCTAMVHVCTFMFINDLLSLYTHAHIYIHTYITYTQRDTHTRIHICIHVQRNIVHLYNAKCCMPIHAKERFKQNEKKKKNMKIYNRGFHAKRSAARCAFKGLHPNYDAGYIR